MPQLPRISPGPRGFGRRASAEDFGAAEGAAQAERGQAVAGFGSALGDIEQAEQRIFRARNEAKVGRLAAELAAADDEAVFAFETDPDLETHGERFEKGRAERLRAAQDQLPPEFRAELEARAFASGAQSRDRVRRNVRQRVIKDSQADLLESGRMDANRAATADPDQREQIRAARQEATERARAANIIDQRQKDDLDRGFDRALSEADFLQDLAVDPMATARELRNPQSPLLRGLDAAEVEQRRKTATNAVQAKLENDRAEQNFRQAQADRAEREAADAAQRDADDALAKGDLQGLQSILKQSREVMTPEQRRWYLERIAKGGGIAGEARNTNPGRYIDLSDKVNAGAPADDEIDAAYRANEITREDADRLLKASKDRRFGDVDDFIARSTVQGMKPDFDRAESAAVTRKQFADWAAANPEATASEAAQKGAELLKQYGFQRAAKLLKATDPTTGGLVDVGAAVQQLKARRAAGEIGDLFYFEELERLSGLNDAQRLQGGGGGK